MRDAAAERGGAKEKAEAANQGAHDSTATARPLQHGLLSPVNAAAAHSRCSACPESGGAADSELYHVTSDGVEYYTSDKWASLYPNQEVAIVTSIGQPPVPPEGYVPLRYGYPRDQQTQSSPASADEDQPTGFSLDTLLWDEKLLEQRIMQLTAWTRRPPMPRRQKLDRINHMVNSHCNSTNAKGP